MSASGGRDGLSIIAFASDRFDSPSQAAIAGMSGAVLAIASLFINFWTALGNVIIVPLNAIGPLLARIQEAFLGGLAGIIGQGAASSIVSLQPGSIWTIGPLGFPSAIAVGGAGLLVMAYIIRLPMTSDFLIGSFTDLPVIGSDEEDEE